MAITLAFFPAYRQSLGHRLPEGPSCHMPSLSLRTQIAIRYGWVNFVAKFMKRACSASSAEPAAIFISVNRAT